MAQGTPQRQTTKGCAPTQRMLPGLWRWYREPCSIDGCAGVYWSGDLCTKHYDQERQKRRYAENPEYFKEQAKRWQAENRERYQAKKRQRRLEHPEIQRARNQRYYEANKEALKAATRAYEKAHAEQGRAWRRRRKALLKSYAIGSITPELLAAKLAYWGGRCWLCGGDPQTWDHVKPVSKGGAHVLANLRPACAKCNSRKRARWPFPTARRFDATTWPDESRGRWVSQAAP